MDDSMLRFILISLYSSTPPLIHRHIKKLPLRPRAHKNWSRIRTHTVHNTYFPQGAILQHHSNNNTTQYDNFGPPSQSFLLCCLSASADRVLLSKRPLASGTEKGVLEMKQSQNLNIQLQFQYMRSEPVTVSPWGSPVNRSLASALTLSSRQPALTRPCNKSTTEMHGGCTNASRRVGGQLMEQFSCSQCPFARRCFGQTSGAEINTP